MSTPFYNSPGTFAIYKTKGVAKFSVIPVTINNENTYPTVERNGAVLVEAAPSETKDPRTNLPLYIWDRKVTFALQAGDISQIFESSGTGEVRLVHKKDNSIKNLNITPGKDKYAGTYMLYMKDSTNQVSVPISAGEYDTLMVLIRQALPRIIGW